MVFYRFSDDFGKRSRGARTLAEPYHFMSPAAIRKSHSRVKRTERGDAPSKNRINHTIAPRFVMGPRFVIWEIANRACDLYDFMTNRYVKSLIALRFVRFVMTNRCGKSLIALAICHLCLAICHVESHASHSSRTCRFYPHGSRTCRFW